MGSGQYMGPGAQRSLSFQAKSESLHSLQVGATPTLRGPLGPLAPQQTFVAPKTAPCRMMRPTRPRRPPGQLTIVVYVPVPILVHGLYDSSSLLVRDVFSQVRERLK